MMSIIDKGETAPPENCRRLVLLGSSKVGKTAIVSRFLHDKFEETYTPTTENFHRKFYKIRGQPYRLDILDTSGHHSFPAMTRLSYITGDLFILLYDVTIRNTFIESQHILEDIVKCRNQATTETDDQLPPATIILVGNKCDKEKERVVSLSEARALLNDENPDFNVIEASAKSGANIDEIFIQLFKMAKLPEEVCPSLHRKVTPSYRSRSTSARFAISRKVSEACGELQPNARRPSVRADLRYGRTRVSVSSNHSATKETRCVVM